MKLALESAQAAQQATKQLALAKQTNPAKEITRLWTEKDDYKKGEEDKWNARRQNFLPPMSLITY